MLNNGARNAHHVSFLKSIGADQAAVHLAGDNNHRNGIHVGGGNAGNSIGRTRPGGDQHHTGLAGCSRVPVGRMGGSLFVAHEDMFDLVLVEDGIVNMQHRPTGIAKQNVHALIVQRTNQHLSA